MQQGEFEVEVDDQTNLVRVALIVSGESHAASVLFEPKIVDVAAVQQPFGQVMLIMKSKMLGELFAEVLREWCAAHPQRLHMRDRLYVATWTALVKALKEPNHAERLTAVGYVPQAALRLGGVAQR